MQRRKVKKPKPQRLANRAGRQVKAKHPPRQARRPGSRTKETHAPEAYDPKAPILSPCSLFGPDGKERPAWELRVGEISFGRADSKDSLLAYYARIHEPPPTGHWRERSWQPKRRTARRFCLDDLEQEELPEADELEGAGTLAAWD
jgi:hypothetical protein